jgi:hypothetical protein
MSSHTSFLTWLKSKGSKVDWKMVSAIFPYKHSDNKGYEVTYNNITQYFFFNNDGILLQRKIIKKAVKSE